MIVETDCLDIFNAVYFIKHRFYDIFQWLPKTRWAWAPKPTPLPLCLHPCTKACPRFQINARWVWSLVTCLLPFVWVWICGKSLPAKSTFKLPCNIDWILSSCIVIHTQLPLGYDVFFKLKHMKMAKEVVINNHRP